MEPRQPKSSPGTFSRLLHTGAAALSLLLPTLKINAAEPPANPAARNSEGKGDSAEKRETSDRRESSDKSEPVDRAALEKRFAESLTGATLVGKYTIEGSDAAPKEDRYRITKVTKGEGDNWTIVSSVEYKGFGIPVSLTIPVKWAGDTPVMTVTDQKIPAIGTFTARVLFYGDHYVGTWDGGHGHAGTLWGKIEHGEPAGGDAGHGGKHEAPATKPAQ
jgi:hypothetical protein